MKFPKFPTNLSAFKKPLQKIEILALVVFVVFLFFPFRIPSVLANAVNSAAGILVIFVIIVFLFVYAHPIVAIVYLLVAYEFIRRSGKSSQVSGSSSNDSSDLHMNSVNGTPELNNTEKDLNLNYNNSLPNSMLPYETNYASIGINSNDADRDKELARINPPVKVANSLEVEVIRERVPANALQSNTVAESCNFSPVYDKTFNLSTTEYI